MEPDVKSISEVDAAKKVAPTENNNLQLAFLLSLLALLVWHGFQTVHFLRDRSSISLAKQSQDAALQGSQKIQSQFQTLMTKTAELAAKGHPGAKMVVDELQKRGVALAPGPEPKSANKPRSKPADQPDVKSLK